MKKKVIEAWMFAENDGYGVSTKCTHEEALEAIKVAMRDYDDARIAETLKLDDVKPSRLYKHRHCDVGTIGSTDCYDCGEPHMSNGRPIFVWHRTKSLSNFSMTSNDKAAGCSCCDELHPDRPHNRHAHLMGCPYWGNIQPTPRTEKKCGDGCKGCSVCSSSEYSGNEELVTKPPTDSNQLVTNLNQLGEVVDYIGGSPIYRVDSEDDAIEAIIREFEEMKWGFSSKYGKGVDSEWLRIVLRSYGDKVRAENVVLKEKKEIKEAYKYGKEEGKRATLDELERQVPSYDDISENFSETQSGDWVRNEVLKVIADMRK